MTTRILARRMWACLPVAVAALTAASMSAGCGSGTDTLLEAVDPDLIKPSDAQSAPGALALYNGAVSRLRAATVNVTSGTDGTWLLGGLLADEWSTSSTFVQNDEIDERSTQVNNSSVTNSFRALARIRTSANQTIAALRLYRPTETYRVAEMYMVRGFAEMQLASDFCNGVPLSDGAGEAITFGKPMSVAEVFTVAIASLDSAIAVVGSATDANNVAALNAARVMKARAQQGLGLIAEAGATVAAVPSTFSYDMTFATSTGDNANGLWGQGVSQTRYVVADSAEGNPRNLLVKNAIPFFSSRDPRVAVSYVLASNGKDTTKAQDGKTFVRVTALWKQTTTVALANYLDAQLIVAEAQLKAGNVTGWLGTLNALRAAPPKVGEVQSAALPALTDPGTTDGRVNLLFREKAYWTFGRGQRLGDLRRLIRQYGRTPETTFPTGEHYRGGNYGADVNLPVPQDEQNNLNFIACTNRNA